MEVDDETDSRTKLEMRKRDITRDVRKLESAKCIDVTSKKVAEGARADRTGRECQNMTRCGIGLKTSRLLEDKLAQSRKNQSKLSEGNDQARIEIEKLRGEMGGKKGKTFFKEPRTRRS